MLIVPLLIILLFYLNLYKYIITIIAFSQQPLLIEKTTASQMILSHTTDTAVFLRLFPLQLPLNSKVTSETATLALHQCSCHCAVPHCRC
jgi:hypothetical protein